MLIVYLLTGAEIVVAFFLNCVGNRRIFEGGELECVDSFGASSLEYARNCGRTSFVNSSTVRRRGVLEFEQLVSDPAPNVCMTVGNRKHCNNSRSCSKL